MRMPNAMETYVIHFKNSTAISLMAYNYDQARLLAECLFPDYPVQSVGTIAEVEV